jgi:hypothetical protein
VIGVVLLLWLLAILAANTLTGNDEKSGAGMLALAPHALF